MLAWAYSKIGDIRNSLYEKGFLKTCSLGAPAISVGNITMGGTGKTPLVAHIAELLHQQGHKVCILTRGYGRNDPDKRVLVSDGNAILADPSDAGDEPYELAQKLPGRSIVLADKDRISAAAWARENFDVDVFVLDDAFQHRRAQRDLDIVCIDAMNPFGRGLSGMLRESPENIARAGAIVITRANLVNDLDDLRNHLYRYNPGCPIFTVSNRSSEFREIGGDKILRGEEIVPQKVFAFCALGNPENFFEQLRREGFDVVGTKAFRDHHRYKPDDITSILESAAEVDAKVYLTTLKDAGKLKPLSTAPWFIAVENRLIFDDETAFNNLIYSVLPLSGGPLRPPQ